ncbi:hypothetical protein HanXRQr2_Chr02g0053391 [Helianthus annuus]|uniref:Uncharacterized protein n=1 Tax=Helianthus annuus TaxID=4232 RepID=A0A251T1R0_HELAN|nr:hypothetical protein HanXRQr2_Chr02g0053391 [Helianthus annuus]KAJ0950808.1 hypothetical protein HanPSC8_Chr02g0052491 [Helianthus annuus]
MPCFTNQFIPARSHFYPCSLFIAQHTPATSSIMSCKTSIRFMSLIFNQVNVQIKSVETAVSLFPFELKEWEVRSRDREK